MRRRVLPLISAIAALVVLAGCNGGGTVTLPTERPSVSVPSASQPAVEAPSVALPTITPPTVTLPTVTVPTIPTQTQTVTETQTATRTAVETETETATQTATLTATQTKTQVVTETQTQTFRETPAEVSSAPETPSSTAPVAAPATETTADEGTTWWPWLLLALLIGGLAWFLIWRRGRQQVLDDWDQRLAKATGEASWVEESLVSQVLSRPTTAEAAAVWAAARTRLLAIDESLHGLTADAPDEMRAAAAAEVRDGLSRLVEAVGADLVAGPDASPDDFRASRAAIDAARRELQAAIHPVEPPVAPG